MRTEVETDLFQHGNHRAAKLAKAIARVRLLQDYELVRAVIASIGLVGRGDWNYSLIERCWVAVGKVEVTVGKVEESGEGGGGCRVTDKSGGQRQLKGGSLVHEGGMGSVLRTEVRQVLGMLRV